MLESNAIESTTWFAKPQIGLDLSTPYVKARHDR